MAGKRSNHNEEVMAGKRGDRGEEVKVGKRSNHNEEEVKVGKRGNGGEEVKPAKRGDGGKEKMAAKHSDSGKELMVAKHGDCSGEKMDMRGLHAGLDIEPYLHARTQHRNKKGRFSWAPPLNHGEAWPVRRRQLRLPSAANCSDTCGSSNKTPPSMGGTDLKDPSVKGLQKRVAAQDKVIKKLKMQTADLEKEIKNPRREQQETQVPMGATYTKLHNELLDRAAGLQIMFEVKIDKLEKIVKKK